MINTKELRYIGSKIILNRVCQIMNEKKQLFLNKVS